MKKKYTEQQNRKRYYLHRKVREQGERVDGLNRCCFINDQTAPSKYVKQLMKEFNYCCQTEIPC